MENYYLQSAGSAGVHLEKHHSSTQEYKAEALNGSSTVCNNLSHDLSQFTNVN